MNYTVKIFSAGCVGIRNIILLYKGNAMIYDMHAAILTLLTHSNTRYFIATIRSEIAVFTCFH